jgi:hypothetical protein
MDKNNARSCVEFEELLKRLVPLLKALTSKTLVIWLHQYPIIETNNNSALHNNPSNRKYERYNELARRLLKYSANMIIKLHLLKHFCWTVTVESSTGKRCSPCPKNTFAAVRWTTAIKSVIIVPAMISSTRDIQWSIVDRMSSSTPCATGCSLRVHIRQWTLVQMFVVAFRPETTNWLIGPPSWL